ncbi:MAG: DinB family protein [Burkholderiaceae bacterium]
MDPLARHLRSHAHNNAWANHRLLGACACLSQAEFEAARVGYFPSIRATLNHLLTVDWYYVDAIERSLRGALPNPAWMAYFDPAEPCADIAALQLAQRASDARLTAVCEGLDAVALAAPIRVPRRDRVDAETLPRLLAHLFQHQTHHRGQAHAMLSGSAVAPPQLDEFFCTGDAPRRAPDLRAMRRSEAQLWGATPGTAE